MFLQLLVGIVLTLCAIMLFGWAIINIHDMVEKRFGRDWSALAALTMIILSMALYLTLVFTFP